MLINAINELERGTPSPPTVAFINSLSRPLSEDMDKHSVYLFARNIDVDLFNHDKVQGLPGQMFVFRSEFRIENWMFSYVFVIIRYFRVKAVFKLEVRLAYRSNQTTGIYTSGLSAFINRLRLSLLSWILK